jgi:hypothetical protein
MTWLPIIPNIGLITTLRPRSVTTLRPALPLLCLERPGSSSVGMGAAIFRSDAPRVLARLI